MTNYYTPKMSELIKITINMDLLITREDGYKVLQYGYIELTWTGWVLALNRTMGYGPWAVRWGILC